MDKELKTILITELERSVYSVVDLDNLKSNDAIENEINKLIHIKKRIRNRTMIILVTCFVCSILLFFPIVYEYAMGDFIKGLLTAGFIGLFSVIYQSRREYDKEIFILNLLKDSKPN